MAQHKLIKNYSLKSIQPKVAQTENDALEVVPPYKGQHHDQPPESYQCPHTGAHFKFVNLCSLLEQIRIERGDPFCEQLPASAQRISATKKVSDSDNDSDIGGTPSLVVMEAKLEPIIPPPEKEVRVKSHKKKLLKLTTEYVPNKQQQKIGSEPEPPAVEQSEISRQISKKLNERQFVEAS